MAPSPAVSRAPSAPSGVRPYRWTREAYERAVDAGVFPPGLRAELLEGQIIEKVSPQGSPHASTIELVSDALREAFGAGARVRVQLPFAAGERSEPEPDLTVVEGSPRSRVGAHPSAALLIVEVSDSTLRDDRGRKARIYANAGVPEYWIVNIPGACVEVLRDPINGAYQSNLTLTSGDTLAPIAAPDAKISVADLLP